MIPLNHAGKHVIDELPTRTKPLGGGRWRVGGALTKRCAPTPLAGGFRWPTECAPVVPAAFKALRTGLPF